MTTRQQALVTARQALANAGIEDDLLECEVLLMHTLKINRVQLYLDINDELNPEEEARFWRLLNRRRDGEPTAYITGHREFYGLDFYVDRRVLIPRPETELLVEKTIALARKQTIATIADIGTGCGNIAICLALYLPAATIYATDISGDALDIAHHNCQKHGVADRVHLRQGDMLRPLLEPVDLLVANMPYVKEAELPRVGNAEPPLALNGGPDGLENIRQLGRQAAGKLQPGGHLLLEIGLGQNTAVTGLLCGCFPGAEIETATDLNSIDRLVCLTFSPATADSLSRRT